MKATMLVVVMGLGGSHLVGQATPTPVPTKWLQDGKLVPDGFSFSIKSPMPDSHWSYTEVSNKGSKTTAFIVDPSADTRYAVMVRNTTTTFDFTNTQKFIDEYRGAIPKDWTVQNADIKPSIVPVKDSAQIRITLQLPDQSTVYAYAYMVSSNGQTYTLVHYSRETSEPPTFTHFAGSFALLPSANSASDWTFYAFMAGMVLVVQVIPIWISVKAKPIGGKPYRWGTYIGIITGFVGASFLLILSSATDLYGKAVGIVLCACAIGASIGILRRRKYGVIMFVTTYLLLIVAVPFLTAMRNEPFTPQQQGQASPVLIFLGLSVGYFVKRWRLMGKNQSAISQPPVPPTPPPISPMPPVQRL